MGFTRKNHDYMIGKKFGKLTVLSWVRKEYKEHGLWVWCLCRCDCGNTKEILKMDLVKPSKKDNVKSCGCGTKRLTNNKHNMSRTRIHNTWRGMKYRCSPNPTSKSRLSLVWQHYGGRGIRVCERWLDFNNFKDDMYESYLEHSSIHGESNTSIERINNNGDYEPSNCRWEVCINQCNNRRDNVILKATSPDGVEHIVKIISKFAKQHGLRYKSIYESVRCGYKHKGWTFEYLDKKSA